MKVKSMILSWGIIVSILGTWLLSYKFSWVIYLLYTFIIICMPLFLGGEIICLRRSKYYEGEKLVIKVPYYGQLMWLLYIFSAIINIHKATIIESAISIYIIIIFLIDLPINYKNSSKIHFFKNGFLSTRICNRRVIPYSEIKKIYFIEYLKGKFLLHIQLEESSINEEYKYKIKQKDKEDIILFINSFIEKEKIIETKEYKEDKLW